jgi:tRNA threonylcarbamoyladenosine biosynthesis protein TsaE
MLDYGATIAAMLPTRAVVFLKGNLGAGKTTLAKGIVEALGAASADEVSSPTFTLIHEYGDPVRVYHIDLYRIEEPRQLFTLGLEEIFDRDAVVLIEWPERFASFLPPPDLTIAIEHAGEGRLVSLQFHSTGLGQ